MSARDEWFRSKEWGPAERALFDQKIKRSRKGYSRGQRFWIKAGALFYASKNPNDPRRLDAIELLERSTTESQFGDDDKSELSHTLEQLGMYRLLVGDRKGAIEALRACIDACARNKRFWHGPISAEEVLARILREDGDHEGARALQDLALAGRWKSYAEIVELDHFVGKHIVGHEPYRDPDVAGRRALERFHCLEIHEVVREDRSSLAALDRYFETPHDGGLERRNLPRKCLWDIVENSLIAELGGYLGRILINVTKAHWKIATPLMKSRLVIGDREVDPFRAAYDAVIYDESLVWLFDQILENELLHAERGSVVGCER